MKNIRNIAIVAHVDHGKTTLVDGLLKTSGIFRDNQEVKNRVMDSDDIERERGITILSKNTAIDYKGVKINIVDTPGHADFGGEVERVLKMVDGIVLVLDSFEGPMPQTKFVLSKAFELKLPAIICINKIDRPDARIEEIKDELLNLFIQMEADESYIDSPYVYASGKMGYAYLDPNEKAEDMSALLDTILEWIPEPKGDENAPGQILISTTDYSEYVGRIGIGRIESGKITTGMKANIVNYNEPNKNLKVTIEKIYEFQGLNRVEVQESTAGNIVAVTGVEGINVGDTICSPDKIEALPFVKISEPTLAITMSVNTSPLKGRDGKFLTSRQIRARLAKELETDVSIRVEETSTTDSFKISGRGELHLSVLIENMRREGYEFMISKPEVLMKKDENGKLMEPIEKVTIDVSEAYVGQIMEKLGMRKGELLEIHPSKGGYTRLEFLIPARGLIGYRQEFLSDTSGNGILNTEFDKYDYYKGDLQRRRTGSLIAIQTGTASSYGLNAAEGRGPLFIEPGVDVYEGMIVGSNPKGLDIEVNVCKKKKETNIRSSASDDAIRLSPPIKMSLEEMMEFIESDELIEVTPKTLRLRKRTLDANLRYKEKK